jgi:tRNA pseudouridine13 synthase
MMPFEDPLPQRCFTDEPGIGGVIKVRPEDFIVEEIPLYEPAGEGEHLYLRVEKRAVSHGELMSFIRRAFGVRNDAIGYAGMKDKMAVTQQTVSVALREDPPSLDLDHRRIKVLWAARHRNKIKRGHLRGNRFAIRIRDVDPLRVVAARSILRRLEATGAPTYYGSQRFGYRRNNHLVGRMLFRQQWADAAAELLGSAGTPFPERQRERRELFDAGHYEALPALWSPADRAELILAKALARGQTMRSAVRAIGRITLNFYVSSTVSAVFNRVLDRRIEAGTVDQLMVGDRAWKHDSRATFPVTQAEIDAGELPPRLGRFEISPTGPIWGDDFVPATDAIGEAEVAALAEAGLDPDLIRSSPIRPEGGRRPFRVPIGDADIEGGVDEHGSYIRVVFDLPRGMYATVVLQELMKNGPREMPFEERPPIDDTSPAK